MIKKKLVFSIIVVGIFIIVLNAMADVKGRLLIEIIDTNGDPIEGVNITIQNKETESLVYTIETNKRGKATLVGVDPVLYHLKAEKEGYQYLEGDIKLRAGIKVKPTWTMKTIEELKAESKATKEAMMTDELRAQDAHNRGVEAYQAGNIEEAKKLFIQAIEYDEAVSYLDYLLLGQFAFAQKKVDEAITYLGNANKYDNEKQGFADINRLLGACYMIQKDYANARKIWSEMVAIEPDASVLYNLANIEIQAADLDKAVEWLTKCMEAFPQYKDAISLLGDVYLQQKDYKNGLEVYREYLVLLEKDAEPDPEKLKIAKDTVILLEELLQK